MNKLMVGCLFLTLISGRIFAQNDKSLSVELDKLITNYLIIQNNIQNKCDLEELIHIDCGANDSSFNLGGNAEDIGRVHSERTYIQGADKSGMDFDNKYFYYQFVITSPQDLIVRFSDADNANRFYQVIINDEYCFTIHHMLETSEEHPGAWKDFYIKVPQKALKRGGNKIMFDHRNMEERSPALSDIWIYKIK